MRSNRPTTINGRLLRASIRKWEKIVAGKGYDAGRSNCPLCKRYNRFHKHLNDIGCGECPISVYTKSQFCNDTPYIMWALHQDLVHVYKPPYVIQCSTCKLLAKQELAFLKKVYKELYGTR